ncbi:MAG: hypothetical protein AAGU21_00975 [Solidesulfovibrio sp.]|uniref:hypothetical protein n=1 Tax=Solidesulfovibrio sp. TaxID=2910990 RepID=UPI002B204691|nr:hypothetical protein [Solidesulfovibrio sp.]MEA4857893.1 hypothetical protein [Solidesulfovibrio sp.]
MDLMERDPDVLTSRDEIMRCLGIGRRLFDRWKTEGMPVTQEGNAYRGYRPTLMAWYARKMQQAVDADET